MCFQVTKSIKIYLKFIYKVLFNVICIVAFNEFFLVSKIRDHSDKCSLPNEPFFRWFKLSGISKITCKLFEKYREPSKSASHFPRRGKV